MTSQTIPLLVFLAVLATPLPQAIAQTKSSNATKTLAPANTVKLRDNVAANKKVARAYYEEVVIKENIPKVNELFTDDAVLEFGPSFTSNTSKSNTVVGKANIRKHLEDAANEFTFKGELLDVIGEGNKVVIYRVIEKTDSKGRKTLVPWVSIVELRDGKISKMTHIHDTLHEENTFKKSKPQ